MAQNPPLRVVGAGPPAGPLLPSQVLGVLIFVLTEVMFFAGLVSAFSIAKASAVLGWPPPGQPRLPVLATALSTGVLLLSGASLFYAGRAFARRRRSARSPFLLALALGAGFVFFQGSEWVALVGEGLTLTSSQHGSFFYLVVGAHALHATLALAVMLAAWRRLLRGTLSHEAFQALRVFWYFVVLLWPVLYYLVYL